MKALEVLFIFFKLGLTSFGGPIAHLGFFHDEFVKKRKWIHEHAYADLVALCQFLPGPASSQVGMALGLSRAGILGSIAAWIGFTMPSALFLVTFAIGIEKFGDGINEGWLHGLKIAAVAVVAQAVWSMIIKLCPDFKRKAWAILVAVAMCFFSGAIVQILFLLLSGIFGYFLLKNNDELPHIPFSKNLSHSVSTLFLILFFALLISLPIAAKSFDIYTLKLFDSFYRAGSLVFGGGHVVLPLLQSEVVNQGWISKESFMAGYGAAQAIPGPLFSFSAYLGALSNGGINVWFGASLALFAAFLPSFLLIIGTLPFWEKLRTHREIKFAMNGINAGVVGLLLAALYNPVWISAIFTTKDFLLTSCGFVLLNFVKFPSWAIVIFCALFARFT